MTSPRTFMAEINTRLQPYERGKRDIMIHRCDAQFDRLYQGEHDMLRQVSAIGWGTEFANWFKKPSELTDDQLGLWREDQREHLRRYGKVNIFVPSRGGYISSWQPGSMTKDEGREAALYLHGKADETREAAIAWARFVDTWP